MWAPGFEAPRWLLAFAECFNIQKCSHDVYTSSESNFAEIKLKSLILAQIERWRHALHMQVERQHGGQPLVASGERVSNTSERAL